MTLCLTCRNEDSCVETDLRKIRGECEYYKPITNADYIRSMSDEELAMWINDITTNALSILALGSDKQTKSIFHWLDWLKEEVKRI